MSTMSYSKIAVALLLTCIPLVFATSATADRDAKQAGLDAACELFYSDFGAQSGNRALLFYDLPECVEAFEYQNSQD